jgi:hemoglobin
VAAEAHSAGANATPYALVGGDAGVRALVERFYDLMDVDPAYAHVRATHGASLDGARDKLHLFLSGWLGGPPLYVERHGHPRLRARHLPFAIGVTERDEWLACMRRALADTGVPDELAAALMPAFFQTADWMRNREGR